VSQDDFHQFLREWLPIVEKKASQLNRAYWILETTGSDDAASLKADLDAEYRLLFQDPRPYKRLLAWRQSGAIKDPLLSRQLTLLIHAFKQNQIPKETLEKMAQKEALLSQSYASFRACLDGTAMSENDLRAVLGTERDVQRRKRAWEASKEIGTVLAPQILDLVHLRNQAAKELGYSDYFQMQLSLQEVDRAWLLETFETLACKSEKAYALLAEKINQALAARFQVTEKELGPWAWSEPFCQEDPVQEANLDALLEGIDIGAVAKAFYEKMGLDVASILKRSDMEERQGKSQHAFCIHIDRAGDIRTLNNVKPTMKWLETVLHELGHAIYEVGLDPTLPWLLREPPHMITTEAMALLAGRQAYREPSLRILLQPPREHEVLLRYAAESLARRQLVFSRWVLVMTAFESELYRDPSQDLNGLWWGLVKKHQKISPPSGRERKMDWACKYHIGLAPVYYFSYLLGEMLASSIQESLLDATGSQEISSVAAGQFLHDKLFCPANRWSWDQLVRQMTGAPLDSDAWLREFCASPKAS
jgi:peptidyl-dipeptidase A